MKKNLLILFFLFISFGRGYCENSLLEFLRSIDEVHFCKERIPLEKPGVKERLEKEILLSMWNKPQIVLWFKRSSRYFPLMDQVFMDRKLPEDLKYIAVIESALRPDIKSSKNAVGVWQFIPSTGMIYGLRIDKFIDERRDIKKSTIAAADYLSDLHEMFGSWELALAAYNIGEMRITKELEAQKAEEYYDLWLPEETMRYIFKAIAVKLIFENSSKLGLKFEENDFYKEYDTMAIKLKFEHTIPVNLASEALNISFFKFKLINPFIVGDYFKKGEVTIYAPLGTNLKKFRKSFNKSKIKWVKEHKTFYYTVKKGDSLIKISEEFQVRIRAILEWNKLDYKDYIYPGQKLIIKSNKNGIN